MGSETWMYESITKHLYDLTMTHREKGKEKKERKGERTREVSILVCMKQSR